MYCKYCNGLIKVGEKHCSHCGKKVDDYVQMRGLSDMNVERMTQQQDTSESGRNVMQGNADSKILDELRMCRQETHQVKTQLDSFMRTYQKEQRKAVRFHKIANVVIVALLAINIILGVVVVVGSSGDKDANDTAVEEITPTSAETVNPTVTAAITVTPSPTVTAGETNDSSQGANATQTTDQQVDSGESGYSEGTETTDPAVSNASNMGGDAATEADSTVDSGNDSAYNSDASSVNTENLGGDNTDGQ